MSVKLCRPKEDFLFEQEHVTIDKSITILLPFLRCRKYAFAKEKMLVISFDPNENEYEDMVCVFYPQESGSELVRFPLEEFNQKFEFVNYTYW